VEVGPQEEVTVSQVAQINPQLDPASRTSVSVVHTGDSATNASPNSGGSSTGSKVAVGAVAVAGGLTLTTILVSAIAGWTIQKTLDKAWDAVRGKKSKARR
jgi:hypothetical protein